MNRGFTLVELIVAIVIGAIILIPTSFVVVESVRNTFLPEYFTIASSLLEDRIEWVSGLRFNDLTDQGPTAFAGKFDNYFYQIAVNYVDSGELNTPVDPIKTDYKRAQIIISHPGFPDLTAITLLTNN